jgi:para-nitrobenzyl esterase
MSQDSHNDTIPRAYAFALTGSGKEKPMKAFSSLLVVAFLLFGSAMVSAAILDPVSTDSGLISGTTGTSREIRVYKGIPFSAPPVGQLRWRAPQPVASWEGVRKADHFGPVCPQARTNVGSSETQSSMSEDCLYLNVWTAAKSAREKRPVMVWSHGGGYTMGSGDSPQFDGEALAKKGVVLVTYNYRLGVFGFFAHPELTRESGKSASGNYGLMDLAAALRWVQKNISKFGGDPNRVTIFGVSAGAGLVANLVGSPEAKGLFQRAIAQSGAWMGIRISLPTTLSQAEAAGIKMAEAVSAKSLAELRDKSTEELLKSGRGAGPIVDGWFIPADLSTIYAQGRQNDVDVLIGSNQDEGTFFSRPGSNNADSFIKQSQQRFGSLADTFLKLYPAGSNAEAEASQLASFRDELAWLMSHWARMQSTRGKGKAYVYYFTRVPPSAPGSPSRGATHGAETSYVFQNLTPASLPWSDLDRRIADTISSYWANFAATGDPNGKGLPAWPAFNQNRNNRRMVLGDKIEMGAALEASTNNFFDAYYSSLQKR